MKRLRQVLILVLEIKLYILNIYFLFHSVHRNILHFLKTLWSINVSFRSCLNLSLEGTTINQKFHQNPDHGFGISLREFYQGHYCFYCFAFPYFWYCFYKTPIIINHWSLIRLLFKLDSSLSFMYFFQKFIQYEH